MNVYKNKNIKRISEIFYKNIKDFLSNGMWTCMSRRQEYAQRQRWSSANRYKVNLILRSIIPERHQRPRSHDFDVKFDETNVTFYSDIFIDAFDYL